MCSVHCVVCRVHTPASGLTHIRDNTAQGHSTGGFLKEATSRVTVFQGKSSGGPVDTAGYIYICCTTLIIKILLARWDSYVLGSWQLAAVTAGLGSWTWLDRRALTCHVDKRALTCCEDKIALNCHEENRALNWHVDKRALICQKYKRSLVCHAESTHL